MKPMTTTALPSYHKRKAGHCVTSFLHVVSGPNNSFALKLVMLVNKNLRGARSTRHRVPEGPLSYYRACAIPRISSPTLTTHGNTVHAWKGFKQQVEHYMKASQTNKLQIQADLSPTLSSGRQRNSDMNSMRMEVQKKREPLRN